MHITDAAPLVQRGLLDPLDLLEGCLDRIARYEDRVHAWVLVDAEGARRDVRRIREDLAHGRPSGPLAGIPIGVKDVMDVAGWPTKAGSSLRENHRAAADCPLVAALRRAGAILLGKTVTVEFACFDPPPTRNPWNLAHTPGGSSSGSAVAVALGMCLAATGTQTGGSLVRPASYCGVSACKPTFGRIRLDGTVPVAYHLDHAGAIARTVGDLELLLRPALDDGANASPDGGSIQEPPRLGLVEPFVAETEDSLRSAMRLPLGRLREAGANIGPAGMAVTFAEVRAMHRRIMAVEAAEYHQASFARWPAAYGRNIASLLKEGLALRAVDYAEALACQRAFRREIDLELARFDALLMPATNTTAPASLETTGDPKFQSPWSFAGVPAISFPFGLDSEGLPAAIQLVARRGDDARLFRIARWCEQVLPFEHEPPLP